MAEYKVKVVVTEELSFTDIERKINDFQSVFATVASRYYSNKSRSNIHNSETEQER